MYTPFQIKFGSNISNKNLCFLYSEFAFRLSPSLLPSVHSPAHYVHSLPAIVTAGPKQEIGAGGSTGGGGSTGSSSNHDAAAAAAAAANHRYGR